MTESHRLGKVLERSRPARRDHRDRYGCRHLREKITVEAVLGAIAVHAREQDLPRPPPGRLSRPLHCVEASRNPPTREEHLPAAAVAPATCVNRHHDALVTKATGGVCDEVGIANRSRVQRDLVGTSRQNRADVVLGAEPAADREGDEHLIGSALNQIDNGVALFVRGGDIEEYQLVSTLPVIPGCQLHGVTRIAQTNEIHAFHDPPPIDIEARDHPDHRDAFSRVVMASATLKRPS